ncbi:class I SAM-dependent DNA methyltransferase [Sphingomonas sp. AP4-R1]|uniref:class I SAM-dependent DNA methyltransferase n=1 Tax=Sphingomonas sp. AP4-R1 TaxID=2735134 RepID=UPI001493B29A|nr:class I SAM-dependent DNA methyltransferase [Sphingomonas sp. AP4-R1]QJU56428.1 class I SAM-dependent DNA methyltransferase [Sphingomonas sp. AP4-R1]
MNAVEIEEAVSDLALQPFDAAEFAFQFLAAFSARDTTLKRLRKGDSNQSDVAGGVLWRGNIHIAVAPAGEVGATLAALRASPKTTAQKAKFILATDGDTVEAEDLVVGDVIACAYADLPRHFATFLPLAGISTVKEIKNNPIDVKATGRLNKLYVELLKDNPDWATEERRHELNQFMARLIFCFFAEDTGIFEANLFTNTVSRMSVAGHGTGDEQWGNTHEVLTELFRTMDIDTRDGGAARREAGVKSWADQFHYVNGGLFTGATDSPRFSRTARAYLLRAGELDWKEINPDIFGSMIQAVADDGERGELGMHYTSVPNILKVLNPLFLDDLRATLEAAGDSKQKLRNLRKRLRSIRVFDPACGSGNFLVIAYKEMRAIEAAIVAKLGGEENLKLADRRSVIPLSNFYGIEIKGFAAEIARLALLIAEFQADCLYLSQQEARAMVLPLHKTGQITIGNALRLDWREVCPRAGAASSGEQDLGGPTGRLALEANGLEDSAEAETYICGNPPYKGSQDQTSDQKRDLEIVAGSKLKSIKSADYVIGWFLSASAFIRTDGGRFAFVTTNSVNQGRQVASYWPAILGSDLEISFAHPSFLWRNLAAKKAAVTVSVVGISARSDSLKIIFDNGLATSCRSIGPYLSPNSEVVVDSRSRPISDLSDMEFGSMPNDGGGLLIDSSDYVAFERSDPRTARFLRPFIGSRDVIHGQRRFCIWINDDQVNAASDIPIIRDRITRVKRHREASERESTKKLASSPHAFGERRYRSVRSMLIARHSAEDRPYLPFDIVGENVVIADSAIALPDYRLFEAAVYASRIHLVWVATVCGKIKTDFRYSNTLGWNTFPVPRLTAQDKADLTRTAENILLAREAHFPATIADLYDPEAMPDDLRRAHEENDEVLERIYIGRRFRNDTERLEKLFDLYTKMTANAAPKGKNMKGKAA